MKTALSSLVLFGACALLLSKNGIVAAAIGTNSASTKIVGGVEATKGEFPWLVLIELEPLLQQHSDLKKPQTNQLDWICVGTIIGDNQIFTAAHCIKGFSASELTVIAGVHNISQNEPSRQRVKVLRSYIHADYHEFNGTSRNDIALLITEKLEFNTYVAPVNIPPSGHEPTGSCWIAGWGQISGNVLISEILLKASIPIVDGEKCSQIYESLVPTIQVCAGKEEGGADACIYDTGGPLLCNDLGKEYIAGIVSWGYFCGRPSYPSVYTKVSRYVDWVPNTLAPPESPNSKWKDSLST